MKTNIKRMICAVFAFAILVCAFSACGSSNTDGASSTGSTKTQSIEGDDPTISYAELEVPDEWKDFDPYASIPDSIKGQTVRFATWINHYETEGNVPLNNFYKDTGLNVELYLLSADEYIEKLVASKLIGDVPDVFKNNENMNNFPLTMQFAAPIDVVSTVNLDEPIWHKSMIETGTIGGHVYLVNTKNSPWSGSNLVFYNKELFAAAGATTPEEYYEQGNWTWDTMRKCMKDVMALGNGVTGGFVDVEVLGDSAGASFCMYDYKTNTFSSGVKKAELQMAYEWYAETRDAGILSTDGMASFKAGKAGICVTGVYGLKNTGHFKDMDWSNIGFTYLPSLSDGTKSKVSSVYRMYGIMDGAPNANAAGYFIRYWLDPDNYDLYDTFISNKAANFYFELTNTEADDKYFNFDDCCCSFVGEKGSGIFLLGAKKANRANVRTELDKVAPVVNKAVADANKVIQDLIKKFK